MNSGHIYRNVEEKTCLIFSIFVLFTVNRITGEDIRVETALGPILGTRVNVQQPLLTDTVSSHVDTFITVPYAEPPIGSLRFQETVAKTPWSSLLNSTVGVARRRCPAIVHWLDDGPDKLFPNSTTGEQKEDEDCLFINIYTPYDVKNPNQTYPVMVYIHGGSYFVGSGNDYEGTILATKGAVVITVNYRLGVLGLFNSGDDRLPGNYAFYDQIEVLRWVKMNVNAFRGDPGKVTVFGNSAGGGSVGILLISPLAKGLIHGVIIQSGPPTAFWAIHIPGTDCNLTDRFEKKMSKVGCPPGTRQQILHCLQQVDVKKFDWAGQAEDTCGSLLEEKPRIDGRVIVKSAVNSIEDGIVNKVPVMIGCTRHEWAANLGWPSAKGREINFETGLNRSDFEFWIDSITSNLFPAKLHGLGAMKFEYTNWTDPLSAINNRKEIIQYFSDSCMVAPSIQLADLLSQHSANKTFFYIFSHVFDFKNDSTFYQNNIMQGAAYHQFELHSVFGTAFGARVVVGLLKNNFSDADRNVSNKMMSMWVNFARLGTPNAESKTTWKQYNRISGDYMDINTHEETMRERYQWHRMNFWNEFINNKNNSANSTAAGRLTPINETDETFAVWLLLAFCLFLLLVVIVLSVFLYRSRRIAKSVNL